MATWPGTRSGGSCGGRTPEGCGFGAFTSRLTQQTCFPARRRRIGPVDQRQRAQAALQVPLRQRGDQPAALAAVGVLAGLGGGPVAPPQRVEELDGGRGGDRREIGRASGGG